jgi:hypothetical protein
MLGITQKGRRTNQVRFGPCSRAHEKKNRMKIGITNEIERNENSDIIVTGKACIS